MNSCRECIHHVVCAVYAPNFDDVLAKVRVVQSLRIPTLQSKFLKNYMQI